MNLILETLRIRRNQLRMSQSEVAKLAGVHRNTISKMENGDIDAESVTLKTIQLVSEALKMALVFGVKPFDDSPDMFVPVDIAAERKEE